MSVVYFEEANLRINSLFSVSHFHNKKVNLELRKLIDQKR